MGNVYLKYALSSSGYLKDRLTKREGKHTIRIGNEWRRHDPVWERLAYYEDLIEQGVLMEVTMCKDCMHQDAHCDVGEHNLYNMWEGIIKAVLWRK